MQDWIPIQEILEGGILRMERGYLKLIRIHPINYHLKSEMEKEAILNSYQLFLKTCNFDMQILIQNKKENLLGHIKKIQENMKKEKRDEIIYLAEQYMESIQRRNIEKNSLQKSFYIVIKEPIKQNEKIESSENMLKENLTEKYLKIKECLARCGNHVEEITNKKEIKNILKSFFYIRSYLNDLQKEKEEI